MGLNLRKEGSVFQLKYLFILSNDECYIIYTFYLAVAKCLYSHYAKIYI